jgi:uncharacterized paraquat-inducible protein A
MNVVLRGLGLALLYVIAAPTYVIVSLIKVIRVVPAIRAIHAGTIECPHCHQINDLDVKGVCPRCRRVSYGNRLRCSCGNEATSFDCDHCQTTIDVL